MRILYLLLAALAPFVISAQDDGYTMYESIILEPDLENVAALSEGLAEHNKTYHSEAPYQAMVWDISTGPNAGKMIWMMGPCTYSDLDNRPSGEHDDHWAQKVVVNLEGMSHGEYWKRNNDLSITDGNPRPILAVRFLELNPGQGYRLQGMLGKVSEALKAADDVNSWSVYINEFQQGTRIGRHVALVRGINSWAEFDESDTFRENFEAHHGEGSWDPFMREWNDVISDSWDEIWTYNAKLSSNAD